MKVLRFFETIYRRDWLRLRVTGETPRADGRADEVYRAMQSGHDRIEDDTIKLAQDQPFGTA